jgi:hypothetical protein
VVVVEEVVKGAVLKVQVAKLAETLGGACPLDQCGTLVIRRVPSARRVGEKSGQGEILGPESDQAPRDHQDHARRHAY